MSRQLTSPRRARRKTARLPNDRVELRQWIHECLRLRVDDEEALLRSIERVFTNNERLWEESKAAAILAVSKGYAARASRIREQIYSRDATVASITRYFETLVQELSERAYRDPKTRLINGARFIDELNQFLSLEQRGLWCAVGLVDVRSFKMYNDALGHLAGDAVLERVAAILAEQIRPDDVLALESSAAATALPARFGGDEFCFLIPRLDEPSAARSIAERFRQAVERYDWTTVDERLAANPVIVDVGVASLLLGPVEQRRPASLHLAHELLACADRLMYRAKAGQASHAVVCQAHIEHGHVVEDALID